MAITNGGVERVVQDQLGTWLKWLDVNLNAVANLERSRDSNNVIDHHAQNQLLAIERAYNEAKDSISDLINRFESNKLFQSTIALDDACNSELRTLFCKLNALKFKWTCLGRHLNIIKQRGQKGCQNRPSLPNDLNRQFGNSANSIPIIDQDIQMIHPLPAQMELNQTLMSNLNDQEYILKKLSETFGELRAEGGLVSRETADSERKLELLNSRWNALTLSLNNRFHTLRTIIERLPSLENMTSSFDMTGSVQHPWKRSVSIKGYPLYTHSESQLISWDHPHMVVITNSLSRYDEIRYCAYRTSMKLRALQRWLLLDICDICHVSTAFTTELIQNADEDSISQIADRMPVPKLLTTLRRIFEVASVANAIPVNIPRATDLCFNWLIHLFDPKRRGQLHPYECQVVLVSLCMASIEEKYAYLFDLTAGARATISPGHFTRFISAMLSIPKWLKEVDAFGGPDPLASLSSYYSYFDSGNDISKACFMEWLRMEPQSIVWLPVLHRLAVSEGTRHEAKCNVCKGYPIIGFRYRSLSRFNFDVCQKCFLLGGSRLSAHPVIGDEQLQEYYIEATSGDDIRDLLRIFANKFKRRASFKCKLGYLPIPRPADSSAIAKMPDLEEQRTLSDATQLGGCQDSKQDEEHIKDHCTNNEDCFKRLTDPSEEHSALANYCKILNTDNEKWIGKNGIDLPPTDSRSVVTLQYDNSHLRSEYLGLTEQHSMPLLDRMDAGVNDKGIRKNEQNSRLFDMYRRKLEERLIILERHNTQLELQLRQLKGIIQKQLNALVGIDWNQLGVEDIKMVLKAFELQMQGLTKAEVDNSDL